MASIHYGSLDLFILLLFLSATSCASLYFNEPASFDGRLVGRMIIICLVGSVIIEFLTIFGSKISSPLDLGSWKIASLVVLFYLLFCAQSIGLCFEFIKKFTTTFGSLHWGIDSVIPIVFALGAPLVLSLAGIPFGVSKTVMFAAVLPISSFISLIWCYRRALWIKPELITFTCILSIGISIIMVFPVTNLLTWDDEVHYRNANDVSYISVSERSASDRMIIELFHMENGFDLDASLGKYPVDVSKPLERGDVELFSREADQNDTSESIEQINCFSIVALSKLGYLPSAIGLWLARLLHLPFSIRFILGKLFNLLAYAAVCAMAVRLAPCKKYVLALIALFPSSVLMAASYSYDPCVVSFTLLGISCLLKMRVSNNEVSSRLFFLALLSLAIGFSPKAIYFPLFGLFLLIPEKRFRSQKHRKLLIFAAVAVCILMVISFVAPYLTAVEADISDVRGGADVSTAGQTYGVLSDPLGTLNVLSTFVFGSLLSPAFLNSISTNLAYLGDASGIWSWYSYLPIILFLFVCLADNDEERTVSLSLAETIWACFLLLVTCFLICLALYISFTGVGKQTIAGVQARYLIPLAIPFGTMVVQSPFVLQKRCDISTRVIIAIGPAALLYSELAVMLYSRFF